MKLEVWQVLTLVFAGVAFVLGIIERSYAVIAVAAAVLILAWFTW